MGQGLFRVRDVHEDRPYTPQHPGKRFWYQNLGGWPVRVSA